VWKKDVMGYTIPHERVSAYGPCNEFRKFLLKCLKGERRGSGARIDNKGVAGGDVGTENLENATLQKVPLDGLFGHLL
jgi:hypothetical protein